MKHTNEISDDVQFPIRVKWEDSDEEELYEDKADIRCNLEDYDSEKHPLRKVTDALGRPVELHVSTTFLMKLKLKKLIN